MKVDCVDGIETMNWYVDQSRTDSPESDRLSLELVDLLKRMPYISYLRSMNFMLNELRTCYAGEIFGDGERLIDQTLDLLRSWVDDGPNRELAQRIHRQWMLYIYGEPEPDPSERGQVFTELDDWLVAVFQNITQELAVNDYLYSASEAICSAALPCCSVSEEDYPLLRSFVDAAASTIPTER